MKKTIHTMTVGVLALQGDFAEHMASLARYSVKAREVRAKQDLKACDALILPGGESTTIAKLLKLSGLDVAIQDFAAEGKGIWGTCAGAILLAKEIITNNPLDTQLSLLPMTIERNAYGRQLDSKSVALHLLGEKKEVLFIRAPKILKLSSRLKVLATWKGDPVLVRHKNVWASTFHSELHERNLVLEAFLEASKV